MKKYRVYDSLTPGGPSISLDFETATEAYQFVQAKDGGKRDTSVRDLDALENITIDDLRVRAHAEQEKIYSGGLMGSPIRLHRSTFRPSQSAASSASWARRR